MRLPVAQMCADLYEEYKVGLMPNNQGLKYNTAFYLQSMRFLARLEKEAEAQHIEQQRERMKQLQQQRNVRR